jgi:hypothetical protein
MIERIVFFNMFQHGDLFGCKEYVRLMRKQLDLPMSYATQKHPKVLYDLQIPWQLPTKVLHDMHRHKFFSVDNTLYINTWIGAYMKSFTTDPIFAIDYTDSCDGCNYVSYRKVWTLIQNHLNHHYDWNIKLPTNITQFFSQVDYSFYNCQPIQDFIQKYFGRKKVLISNGPAMSGQSGLNHDMSAYIDVLANEFPEYVFFMTTKTNIEKSNVVYTDDIIPQTDPKCDINEISYLSTFCDVIIGRNSGPFLYTNTKQNLLDSTKTFLALSKLEAESFPFSIKVPSNFTWSPDIDDSVVLTAMRSVLNG